MAARFRTEVGLFVLAAAVYGVLAGPRLAGPSPHDHYARQASAWLEGRLDLPSAPPHRNDWASWHEVTLKDGRVLRGVWRTPRRLGESARLKTLDGRTVLVSPADRRSVRTRWFVSFPPMPSLLMLPLVAAFGTHVNDVLLTLLLAAFNAVLMFRLLRVYAAAGLSGRSHVDDRLLTLVFAFGTAHAWCAVLGQVWFTGLIVGVTCGLLFLLAVETGRPWSAGLALAAAMATRPHLALLGLYLPLRRGGRPGILLRASLPPLIAAVGLALYNHARFERVAEFGHTYLAAGGLEHIARHGLFNGAYLARNLTAALALLPTLHADPPYLTLSRHGMALWWSTPVLLWAVPSLRGTPSSARRALAWTALAVALPWVCLPQRPLLRQLPGMAHLLELDSQNEPLLILVQSASELQLFSLMKTGQFLLVLQAG